MTDDFLNVRETAERLGVHENTIRNWQKQGILPAVLLPGSGFRRFPKAEVERMRREMFEQFAPATEMPRESKRPQKASSVRLGGERSEGK